MDGRQKRLLADLGRERERVEELFRVTVHFGHRDRFRGRHDQLVERCRSLVDAKDPVLFLAGHSEFNAIDLPKRDPPLRLQVSLLLEVVGELLKKIAVLVANQLRAKLSVLSANSKRHELHKPVISGPKDEGLDLNSIDCFGRDCEIVEYVRERNGKPSIGGCGATPSRFVNFTSPHSVEGLLDAGRVHLGNAKVVNAYRPGSLLTRSAALRGGRTR